MGSKSVRVSDTYSRSQSSSCGPSLGADEGEDMSEPKENLQKEGVNAADDALKRRIFDDIITTLQYARTTYDSNSVSLAGVGTGAGLALEASCELYNMACLSQIYQLDDYTSTTTKSDGNGNVNSWSMCGGLWKEQGRMVPPPPASVNYYRALSMHRNSTSGEDASSHRPFSFLQDYFDDEQGSLFVATTDEDEFDAGWEGLEGTGGDDFGDDTSASTYEPLTAEALEIMAENALAKLVEEHDDCVPEDAMEEDEEPEVLEDVVASTYFGDSSDRSPAQSTSDEILHQDAIRDEDIRSALQRAHSKANEGMEAQQATTKRKREKAYQLKLMKEEEEKKLWP